MSEPEVQPSQADLNLEPVVEKISTEHGFDVRGYKRTTLFRRIRKRMADVRCSTVADYLVRLETHPHEYSQLVNTILINVTEFFRDPDAWEYVQRACLEPMLRQGAGQPVRAWSVGCATGEEAYSLSICMAELVEGQAVPVKIYATDMDEDALAAARAGVYDPDNFQNVSPARRERFFEELPGGKYRVRRDIRTSVIFGHHNVLEHAPISRLDILVCRNVLIYFDNATQQELLRRFHYAVRDGGYLFLGKAETLMSRSGLFRPLEPRYRVFQRVPLKGSDCVLLSG
jgi:two-component system, chemotaxis family, CheB/CheR fusion protein